MMSKENIENAIKSAAELRVFRAKVDKLLEKIEIALHYMLMWPEAHATGTLKMHIDGNWRSLSKMRLVLERSDGEKREFPVAELSRHVLKHAIMEFDPGERMRIVRQYDRSNKRKNNEDTSD